jgi:glycosyltransferase involved in cell wall biosynthesis
MQILFLLTQDLESPSGLGRYWPLARHLARLGHNIEIAALHPSWQSLESRVFLRDGVRVRYVAQMHVRREGNRQHPFNTPQLLWVTAKASLALAAAAMTTKAEIIHVAKAQPMNGLAGLLGRRVWRSRRLYLDCDDYEAVSNRFGGAWQKDVVRSWEDRRPLAARATTVNTTFLRARCLALGVPAERLLIVPNGFDPDRFRAQPAGAADAVRRRHGLAGNPVVLYLGSFSLTSHPVLLLLDAFVSVSRKLPSARLLLVGGGEDYNAVASAIGQRGLGTTVVLAGRVSSDDVPAIYQASDVLVDPVVNDDTARARSPLKVAEAMACGVPVVTGDVGDRAATLEGGEAGVLVRPDDAGALAEGILSVLLDSERRDALSSAARKASRRLRWDSLVHDFASIYTL